MKPLRLPKKRTGMINAAQSCLFASPGVGIDYTGPLLDCPKLPTEFYRNCPHLFHGFIHSLKCSQ